MFIFAVLDKSILEKIYELTYKYGWIKYDEDILGWLSEPAYIAKYKMEGELSEYLNVALDELIETYKDWLSKHKQEGFKEYIIEGALAESSDEKEQVQRVLSALDNWKIPYADSLYQIVENALGGSREMLDNEDSQSLKEAYGRDFINTYISKLPPDAGKALQKEYEQKIEEQGEEAASAEIIDNYDLEEYLKNWMINDTQWSGSEWLKEVYRATDLVEQFSVQIAEHLDELLDSSYGLYLEHFETPEIAGGKSLRENIEDIENTLQILMTEKNGDLDQRIKALQYGLTTAHHYGTMADHLLDTGKGGGEEFLDLLSEGPQVEDWDKDLEEILGHPKGSLKKEVYTYWINPEEQEFQSLHGNRILRLSACISAILF